jgi:hypothetical protein
MRAAARFLVSGACLSAAWTPAAAQAPDPRSARFGAEMRQQLRDVAQATWDTFSETLNFWADSILRRAARTRGPVRIVPLWLSPDSGWSAVAFHDSLPGTVCGISYGVVPPPVDPDAQSGDITCAGEVGAQIPGSREAPSEGRGRVRLLVELDATSQPKAVACAPLENLPDLHGPKQQVRLEVIIDRGGRALPSPVRVIEARGLTQAREALWVIQSCQYQPGQLDSVRVRTAVRIPVQLGDK